MKNLQQEIARERTSRLLILGTVVIQKQINFYMNLLKSDKFFTEEDYRYFGEKIYFLRLHRKKIAEELALRFCRLTK